MHDFKLLRRLCDQDGVSTDESGIAFTLRHELEKFMSAEVDAVGNLIAKNCDQPEILITAHMDEIGLIVKNITDQGFIEFEKLGGIVDHYLPFQRVVVHGRESVQGIVSLKIDPSMTRETLKTTPVRYQDLYIDTGLSRQELTAAGVFPGTIVSFDQKSSETDDLIYAKALDNRVGCFVALEVAKRLNNKIKFGIIFTVQEEIGLKGMKAAIGRFSPRAAIEIEIMNTSDVPNLFGKPVPIAMGKGPVVVVADGGEGLINGFTADRKLLRRVQEKFDPSKLQWRIVAGGTSDASAIQLAGIPALSVCVPLRYAHTPVGFVKKSDILDTINFVEKVILECL